MRSTLSRLILAAAICCGVFLALPAEAGLFRGVGGTVPEDPDRSKGSIATNTTNSSGGGDAIYSNELAEMIETHIGSAAGTDYESMIFAFTQCYPTNTAEDFLRTSTRRLF